MTIYCEEVEGKTCVEGGGTSVASNVVPCISAPLVVRTDQLDRVARFAFDQVGYNLYPGESPA